jgi:hypothetical protein
VRLPLLVEAGTTGMTLPVKVAPRLPGVHENQRIVAFEPGLRLLFRLARPPLTRWLPCHCLTPGRNCSVAYSALPFGPLQDCGCKKPGTVVKCLLAKTPAPGFKGDEGQGH